jgi:thioredoxin
MEDDELERLRQKRFEQMTTKISSPEGWPVVHLTECNFNEVTLGRSKVVIDFWAEWCGPCRYFSPIFEEMSIEFPEIQFCKCDVDHNHGIATQLSITNIPRVMYVSNGTAVRVHVGAMSAEKFREELNVVFRINDAI